MFVVLFFFKADDTYIYIEKKQAEEWNKKQQIFKSASLCIILKDQYDSLLEAKKTFWSAGLAVKKYPI